MDSLLEHGAGVESLAVLSRFRLDFHGCLTARRDELSELADAVLCADGPVRTLAGLSLAPEHRRGHGALYDAVNHGQISIGRLRRSLAGLPARCQQCAATVCRHSDAGNCAPWLSGHPRPRGPAVTVKAQPQQPSLKIAQDRRLAAGICVPRSRPVLRTASCDRLTMHAGEALNSALCRAGVRRRSRTGSSHLPGLLQDRLPRRRLSSVSSRPPCL
jgi:hypothetical protein